MINTRQLAAQAGVSYRRVDHWTRRGHVECLNPDPGHGYDRMHPDTEVNVLDRVNRLTIAGFRIPAAFRIARALANGPVPLPADFVIFDPEHDA